jgi:hypothetical protein
LPREDLDGELPAVFASHCPLDAFDNGRNWASIVLELLGAVLDTDAGPFADVFVISALVRILEPAPAAHVVDENGREVSRSVLNVVDQLLQGIAAIQPKSALSLIGIGANDFDPASSSILLDRFGLIFRRVFLVVSGHPHVFSSAH